MTNQKLTSQLRGTYQKLVRLYPETHRERFGESMEQTFADLLRERSRTGGSLFGFALWLFVETALGMIQENARQLLMQNIAKRLFIWAGVTALLLLIPLLGTIRDAEIKGGWKWSPADFLVMGALMFGAACAYELVARRMPHGSYRIGVALAVMTALLLIWVNGAVGIIGDGPVNLLYLGVVAVGLVGALLARFNPRGMARAVFSMALAQTLVPLVALLIWGSQISWSPGVFPVFAFNAVFVGLFIGSALLFRRAARAAA